MGSAHYRIPALLYAFTDKLIAELTAASGMAANRRDREYIRFPAFFGIARIEPIGECERYLKEGIVGECLTDAESKRCGINAAH